jgi:hypothetical protein
MIKKSNKFDRKIRNKVPIFKEDLEFEIFHAKNLQQIDNDKLNFQKEYFNKVSKVLSVIDKKERVSFLEKMISDNNIEDFKLEGLNQLDRQEEIHLENTVLLFIIKNYQAIPVRDKNDDKSDVIYQTSYFVNKFSNSDQKIGILYDKLIADKYIDCSKRTFSSIFFVKNNFSKVNWLKSQSSFQFFIQQLVENKKISCNYMWVVAAACFLINDKEKTNIQLGKVETPSSIDAIKIKECIKDFNRIVA